MALHLATERRVGDKLISFILHLNHRSKGENFSLREAAAPFKKCRYFINFKFFDLIFHCGKTLGYFLA